MCVCMYVLYTCVFVCCVCMCAMHVIVGVYICIQSCTKQHAYLINLIIPLIIIVFFPYDQSATFSYRLHIYSFP